MLIKEKIKFLVVHCSDTNDDSLLNARDIHQMHLDFGWNGIGYHKIICRSGKIQDGRPEFWIGAHVKSYNHVSLGVCLIGRNHFTNDQFISLENILRKWKISYPKAKIIGHRDIGNTDKTCPNFDVIAWSKKVHI